MKRHTASLRLVWQPEADEPDSLAEGNDPDEIRPKACKRPREPPARRRARAIKSGAGGGGGQPKHSPGGLPLEGAPPRLRGRQTHELS